MATWSLAGRELDKQEDRQAGDPGTKERLVSNMKHKYTENN